MEKKPWKSVRWWLHYIETVARDLAEKSEFADSRWNSLVGMIRELQTTFVFQKWDDRDEEIAGLALHIGLTYFDLMAKPDPTDARPEVEISIDEHTTNDAAAEALVSDQEIFQREGALVWIRRGENPDDGIRRPEDCPRIMELKAPTLRERLSRAARFGQTVETDEGPKFQRRPIPQKCVDAVFARGSWRGIRPLAGVVSIPVLRKDGSILNTPGYDASTRLFYQPDGVEYVFPEQPSRDDAIAAANRLLDLVCDFPFAGPAHRSTWLASILTPLARHAFDGPAPLFLFDANIRAAGKTLLAELVSRIVMGMDFSRMNNPTDDAECRKLITSLVLFGDTMVLIDNVVGTLGCGIPRKASIPRSREERSFAWRPPFLRLRLHCNRMAGRRGGRAVVRGVLSSREGADVNPTNLSAAPAPARRDDRQHPGAADSVTRNSGVNPKSM